MDEYESLRHPQWECKYPVVVMPKCRRKPVYTQLRQPLGEGLRTLAAQTERRIAAGPLMPAHVPMLMAIPPKSAVSQGRGSFKGKSAIPLARVYGEPRRNCVGQHFGARGSFVSTVGREEAVIREHSRHQEEADQRCAQLNLGRSGATSKVPQ
jgi:putative transposase